jgi:hypothetical protein
MGQEPIFVVAGSLEKFPIRHPYKSAAMGALHSPNGGLVPGSFFHISGRSGFRTARSTSSSHCDLRSLPRKGSSHLLFYIRSPPTSRSACGFISAELDTKNLFSQPYLNLRLVGLD